jgi:3-oxoacyl-[acyl-carrier-protein] synthase-3
METTAEWIRNVSGIEERRYAAEEETVAALAVKAGQDCLERCGAAPGEVGLLLVASGSAERRFPGPAASVAAALGCGETPALDVPLASAGSLFGLALGAQLCGAYGTVLVVAAEKMSTAVQFDAANRGTAMLFGDGAGAALLSAAGGVARVVSSVLHSDGAYAEDLRLEFGKPLEMNGRSVILQASRKVPRAIEEVLGAAGRTPAEIGCFLMHQANQNLIVRIAEALAVPPEKFFSNIHWYGNTSSASLLIAAREWSDARGFRAGEPVVFAAFGAGFHWGALLAEGC